MKRPLLTSMGERLAGVLLIAGLLVSPQATAAQSQLPQEAINAVISGCINNTALMWATPGSASKLCPCFVQNILDMPLRDSQRIILLGAVGGGEALRQYEPELMLSELRAEAFSYMGRIQKGCTL